MKKLSLFLIFISLVSYGQVTGPKISAMEKEYDFGTVEQGEIVLHDYEITNTGDDLLVISRVRASCGCTAVKPEKSELKPGESTKVHAEFNSRGRKGTQRKYIYIYSNDPQTPEMRLKLTGTVVVPDNAPDAKGAILKLEKNQHNFGDVKEGEVVDVTIKFKNVGDKTLEIKDVSTSCGCTAAILSSKILKPGKTGQLRVEFDSSNRSGHVTRTVTITSNDKQHPKQTITIFANITK